MDLEVAKALAIAALVLISLFKDLSSPNYEESFEGNHIYYFATEEYHHNKIDVKINDHFIYAVNEFDTICYRISNKEMKNKFIHYQLVYNKHAVLNKNELIIYNNDNRRELIITRKIYGLRSREKILKSN